MELAIQEGPISTPPRNPHLHRAQRGQRRIRAWLVILFGILLFAPTTSLAQTEPAVQTRAQRASVFLMQAYEIGGIQALSCVGSGTLIGSTGLILSNAHLALSEGPCRAEKIIVALPVRVDEPPVPTYLAELVQANTNLNLAVLQITAGLDGSVIDRNSLNLPFVRVASEPMSPGDTATFVGYPNIGADSVTSIEQLIAGISAETGGGKQAWLRVTEPLPGTMSGGGMYNAAGELSGLMSSAPTRTALEPGPTCSSLQDTNRDNFIDERDACVPLNADLTTIRPISLADRLINAAREGLRVNRKAGLQFGPPAQLPAISRAFVSQQVTDFDSPTRIVKQLPSGARSLFLFWNYENMRPGIPYEVRVALDGRPVPAFGQGPQMWGGGERGLWYVGAENLNWPSGNYEFSILLDGRVVQTTAFVIGDGLSEPAFNSLSFGVFDDAGTFTNPGDFLPANLTTVTGRFNYENMREGLDWSELWFFGNEEVFRNTLFWSESAAGQRTVNAINAQGLPTGIYRLDLLVGQELVATADLTLAGVADRQLAPSIFSNISMSSDISRDGLPSGVRGNLMPPGTSDLYAFVSWDDMPTGVQWTQLWTRDGRPIASATQRWDSGQVGDNFWVNLSSDDGLDDGNYRVELFVKGRLMTAAAASIGTGAGALTGEVGEEDSVEVTGRVLDALTGEGIASAGLYVLKTEFDFADFLWDSTQLQAQGISDRLGRFALSDALPRGTLYTFLVRAEGYLPVSEDGFPVLDNQESPMDIVIELTPP